MSNIFDDLKKFAISDILSVSGKDKTARVIENHMNNLIEVALIKGAASRQVEIDSLKIELNGANERAVMTLNHKNKLVDKMWAEINELQKRIDSIVNAIDKYKYSSGERILREIKELLK